MSVGILCDRVWKGYCVTNRKGGTKLHEEKSIQGSIALHIANLCRILIFRNVLWISDAEHGISMLDKYQNVGWKKFYLIYGMCDETFSVNCTTEVPEGVDKGWFMFFVTLLNQIYWVGGATAGTVDRQQKTDAGSRQNPPGRYRMGTVRFRCSDSSGISICQCLSPPSCQPVSAGKSQIVLPYGGRSWKVLSVYECDWRCFVCCT